MSEFWGKPRGVELGVDKSSPNGAVNFPPGKHVTRGASRGAAVLARMKAKCIRPAPRLLLTTRHKIQIEHGRKSRP